MTINIVCDSLLGGKLSIVEKLLTWFKVYFPKYIE